MARPAVTRRRRAWNAYKGRDCSCRTPSPPVRSSPTPLAVEGNKGFRAIATQSVLYRLSWRQGARGAHTEEPSPYPPLVLRRNAAWRPPVAGCLSLADIACLQGRRPVRIPKLSRWWSGIDSTGGGLAGWMSNRRSALRDGVGLLKADLRLDAIGKETGLA